MPRDDFSKQTLDLLAKRVGVRCSNPSCGKLTTGPRTESHHILSIGVGAHITAASPGGVHYDPSRTPQQRQAPDNGIWLCQNCAKLIDNDVSRYSVRVVREWKARAEASALAELEGRTEPQPTDLSAEIDLSHVKERIRSECHDYRLQVTITNRGTEPLGAYHIDLEMPAIVVRGLEEQSLYVRSRSTRDVAFFRATSGGESNNLYPGDTEPVMSITYYMDRDIFWSREDLFERPIKVTLYRRGFRPFTIERPVEDFQIF